MSGPYFSAVDSLGVTPPRLDQAKLLERFLIGVETDPEVVLDAIDGCAAAAGPPGPPPAPDARGALLNAAQGFFELLETAYSELHPLVRDERRRQTEDAVARWQDRLEAAAADVAERAQLLAGLRVRAASVPRPGRRSRDRPALAVAFVIVALLLAGSVLWLVQHGWPIEPVTFGR